MSQERLYRPCVGIVLFNEDNHVFVGERIDNPGAWQMPQGGVDDGENIQEAAFRELKEEVGTDKADLIEIADEKLRYDLPEEILQRLWNGKYAGQEQTWVALRFTGKDEEINLNSHEPPEFSAWKWVPLEETINLIVPFKTDVYSKVIALFSKLT